MAQEERKITWRLSDDGMGVLERAGLAALYMSLRTAEEQTVDLLPIYRTAKDLTTDAVTLRWTGSDEVAFQKLFAWAWQVRDGVFYLPGVHRELKQKEFAYRRVPTHNGLLGTFLQHSLVQPRATKDAVTTLIEPIEEDKHIQVRFLAVDPQKHGIKPLKDLKKKLFRKGRLKTDMVSLSGWLVPGIAPRYGIEKAWRGSAGRTALLMLAPIACCYQRLKGAGSNWIFVVPDVMNLEEFSEVRPHLLLEADAIDVASLGDAGLRFAAAYGARSLSKERTASCIVVAMGKVSYYKAQSVRKAVLEVKPSIRSVARYRCLLRAFPNTYISLREAVTTASDAQLDGDSEGGDQPTEIQEAVGFFKVPSGRGRIADNIISGTDWYRDLFVPLRWDLDGLERQRKTAPGKSVERIWFQNLNYQRRSLMELTQEADMWDNKSERDLVEAFWAMLASLYAQEAKAVDRGGSRKIDDRLEDLNEDIRRALMRAKTRVLLRGYLAELFAKGGRQPAVVQNRAAIWNLIDHPYDWKKARDLSLLALATYQSKEKREQSKAKNTQTTQKGEEQP